MIILPQGKRRVEEDISSHDQDLFNGERYSYDFDIHGDFMKFLRSEIANCFSAAIYGLHVVSEHRFQEFHKVP